MNIYAIRGAITVDRNEKDEILTRTSELLRQMMETNYIKQKDIISIIFTGTRDITAVYPALAARQMGMTDVPLMCFQELDVEGSLPLCIRIMIHISMAGAIRPKHVYLGKAAVLRPDLAAGSTVPSKFSIAIDGPAGAGKSTIAKMLAQRLDILYLDTGAMYRAIALKIAECGGDPSNPSDVIPQLSLTDVSVRYENGIQKVFLDGHDVTDRIRSHQISSYASAVSAIPEVRLKLVELQRKIAEGCSVVMDGRDIGTYVLPNADRKIFLTASAEERARRRWRELKDNGQEQDYCRILQDIVDRDYNDSHRSFAPLKKADDAVLVDTTGKNIDEVLDEILRLIK